jgi:Na+/H+ antiporter NhaC
MAAATDHIDHVQTQLPYALLAAAASLVLFLLAGFALN